MALESATFVNALAPANPSSGDPVTQADDHLRLIKSVLVASFPNLNGAALGTPLQMNSWVPTGSLHLWYSTVASIPAGYGVCDGSTYTKADGSGSIVSPDLRDRFVLGTGPLHAQGSTGGASSVSPATGSTTAAGTIAVAAGGAHDHGGVTGGTALTVDQMPAHTHGGIPVADVSLDGGGVPGMTGNVKTGVTTSTGNGSTHSHTLTAATDHTHTAAFTGTGHVHSLSVDTVPPYVSLVWMIKL